MPDDRQRGRRVGDRDEEVQHDVPVRRGAELIGRRGIVLAAASALAALAAWPLFAAHTTAGAAAAVRTPAPLRDDAAIRRDTIAALERSARRDPQDAITPRMLSQQELQRYRERGDVGDLVRAEADARRSLAILPRGNVAGRLALADALLTLHRFRDARAEIRDARATRPDDPGLLAQEAALDLELGAVGEARAALARAERLDPAATGGVRARYDELTGRLDAARRELAAAGTELDTRYDVPAERRAWYHVRLGELAFEAGDLDASEREERTALARFPADAKALTDLARVLAAEGRWAEARDAANGAVAAIPSPENLGLLADAQTALGAARDAAATRDEIEAVARIGNAYGLNDRLLAVYDADHGVRLGEAYAIARRELAIRDDVYAEDTLAWTAAKAGHWDVASRAARRATALGTADARLWYHAGVIAEHGGDAAAARDDLTRALALNPRFDAAGAADARARLARLGADRGSDQERAKPGP